MKFIHAVCLGIMLGGFITVMNGVSRWHKETYVTRTEMNQRVFATEKMDENDWTEAYNQGYRGGSMDTLAELVECEGIRNENVVRKYHLVSGAMQAMGELDTTPYPCTE